MPIEVTCYYCKRKFWLKPHRARLSENHYCDRECMSKGYILKHERARKPTGDCPQCGKPVYKPISKRLNQQFCNTDCYKKWRGEGPSVKDYCAVCSTVFYRCPQDKQKTCSSKCGYTFMSESRRVAIICKNCGKSFTRWKSYAGKHTFLLCSPECFAEYNKLSTSFSWKGGSYRIDATSYVMILIGRYIYKSANRTGCNLKYKRRSRVTAELYLGYDLKKNTSIVKLGSSDREKNLYICSSHSECIKILRGSLPLPKETNLPELKRHQLYKDDLAKEVYERFPGEWISKWVANSYHISQLI